MEKRSIACIFAFLMMLLGSGLAIIPSASAEDYNGSGPWVDYLVFNVIAQDDLQVLALQNDEIDLIGDMIDPTFLETILESENIDVANVLRNGYGSVTINTQKYPLSITDFRRATAFALDKEGISNTAWDGLSQPHDSPIPVINPFTIEGQLPYTYYEANVALGNYMLDRAGFDDLDDDGIREAPNGDPFDVIIECDQSSNIAIETGQYVADALVALGVDATAVPSDFYEYLNRLCFHGDYDMAFLETDFGDNDVDWLAYEFWSEFVDEPYQNRAGFANATFDSWRDQLLHATEYADVYEAAIEMQEILVYQCPIIVCYENIFLSAYRTDRFEGHVNDVNNGVPGWWTNYKVHLQDPVGGPNGGTFRWSTSLDIDSFNFMVSSSNYANNINMMMWDSLMRKDPDGTDGLWLAQGYLVETHDDNPEVPAGYTQMTFDLVQNATWTDGTPLTAEDVAFTLNYYRDAPGNPYGVDLSEMTAAYAPTTYRLIVQFNSESYWHLHTVAYKPVLPKHVFSIVGLDGWNLWNPNPPVISMVTSGPFTVTDYVAGEFCEMTYNPDYFYLSADIASAPTIGSPSPVTYVEGTTGNTILWSAYSEDPWMYYLYRDSSLLQSGSWGGGNILIDIDGLSEGVYEYELVVYDTSYGSASATVTVTVLEGMDHSRPTITRPSDISYFVGETGNDISWTVEDESPSSYTIHRNGTLMDQGDWSSPEEITIDVDGLGVGSYIYLIAVYDIYGNFVTDTVMVTVRDSTPGPVGENLGAVLSIGITIGSFAVIIIVSAAIYKSKRDGQWENHYY